MASAASRSRVSLNWTDNSDNEAGFAIERSEDAGRTFTQIAAVGAGVTHYTVTGLSGRTWYYFRVSAFNDAGSSDYSNMASVKTPRH